MSDTIRVARQTWTWICLNQRLHIARGKSVDFEQSSGVAVGYHVI